MKVNRIIGIILLAGGAVVFFYGIQASESVWEQINEGLTGRYTDTTMWYLIGGAVSAIVGAVMLSGARFSWPQSD